MFEIRQAEAGDIVMTGRLDASQCEQSPQVPRRRGRAPGDRSRGLEYISSAGLGVLLKTQKRAMASGKGLRLVNVNRHIQDIFQATRVSTGYSRSSMRRSRGPRQAGRAGRRDGPTFRNVRCTYA